MDEAPTAAPDPIRVLIAEDSPTQAQRLRYILESNGYAVAHGANGRLALELAPAFRPELIISDVLMPEMGGYELAGHVKADPALRHVPVILVTTMSDAEDVIRGLECGADHFVLKPYEEKYLLRRIRHVLHNRGTPVAPDDNAPIEVRHNGQRHFITADRRQILHLLLSTYEAAMQRNKDLARSQDEMRAVNRLLDGSNAELSSANRFLDRVIENIPHMVFVKSATDRRFVRINRAGLELLGYTEDEIRGKTDHDLFPAAQADLFASGDAEVLSGKCVVESPAEPVQTRYRGQRILRTKKIPIVDENDQPLFVLGISEDVTEERARELQILDLNEALERRACEVEASNRELDAFTASVSHDLRAPLRHIDAYAEMLDESSRDRLSEEAQRYLGIVRRASQQMAVLIDDLLAFARAGRSEMHWRQTDMGALIETCVAELALAVGQRRVEWTIAPLPVVHADPAMLKQVFANLLGNAVKYTQTRSVAHIDVRGSVDANGLLTVRIQDNGVGFDPAHADRLFGVFQRLHPPEDFEGTGLGLASVRRIIERHGGQTWAESEPGGGATFGFTLPVAPRVAINAASPAQGPVEPPASGRFCEAPALPCGDAAQRTIINP